jgi:hypothetical protein
MGDKLVVGYQEFVSQVSAGLEATDEHSCQEQDGVKYRAMAKTLWASGYRFDPGARRAWLIVELRSKMPAELQEHFAELLRLAEIDDA